MQRLEREGNQLNLPFWFFNGFFKSVENFEEGIIANQKMGYYLFLLLIQFMYAFLVFENIKIVYKKRGTIVEDENSYFYSLDLKIV